MFTRLIVSENRLGAGMALGRGNCSLEQWACQKVGGVPKGFSLVKRKLGGVPKCFVKRKVGGSVARLGGLPPNWASFDRLGPENNALGG